MICAMPVGWLLKFTATHLHSVARNQVDENPSSSCLSARSTSLVAVTQTKTNRLLWRDITKESFVSCKLDAARHMYIRRELRLCRAYIEYACEVRGVIGIRLQALWAQEKHAAGRLILLIRTNSGTAHERILAHAELPSLLSRRKTQLCLFPQRFISLADRQPHHHVWSCALAVNTSNNNNRHSIL